MANILKIIHYAITLVVAVLSIIIGGALVLPSLKIFIPGLGFDPLTQAWNAAMATAMSFSGLIIGVFFAFYLFYKICLAIFPINLFIWAIPPFVELRQAGIFGLFDSLINALIIPGSTATRLKRVARGIGGFVKGNYNMVIGTIREITGINPNKRLPQPKNLPPQSKPQDYPAKVDQSTSPFSDEEVQQTQQEYQQCLEETLNIITPDMSDTEVQFAKAKNTTATIVCQVKAVQSALNNFAFRV